MSESKNKKHDLHLSLKQTDIFSLFSDCDSKIPSFRKVPQKIKKARTIKNPPTPINISKKKNTLQKSFTKLKSPIHVESKAVSNRKEPSITNKEETTNKKTQSENLKDINIVAIDRIELPIIESGRSEATLTTGNLELEDEDAEYHIRRVDYSPNDGENVESPFTVNVESPFTVNVESPLTSCVLEEREKTGIDREKRQTNRNIKSPLLSVIFLHISRMIRLS